MTRDDDKGGKSLLKLPLMMIMTMEKSRNGVTRTDAVTLDSELFPHSRQVAHSVLYSVCSAHCEMKTNGSTDPPGLMDVFKGRG